MGSLKARGVSSYYFKQLSTTILYFGLCSSCSSSFDLVHSIYGKISYGHFQNLLHKFDSISYRFFAIFKSSWRLYRLRKFHFIEILSRSTFANQTIMIHITLTVRTVLNTPIHTKSSDVFRMGLYQNQKSLVCFRNEADQRAFSNKTNLFDDHSTFQPQSTSMSLNHLL